ncbi:hypothetical protein ACJX0J_026054, partial [Zea mays]
TQSYCHIYMGKCLCLFLCDIRNFSIQNTDCLLMILVRTTIAVLSWFYYSCLLSFAERKGFVVCYHYLLDKICYLPLLAICCCDFISKKEERILTMFSFLPICNMSYTKAYERLFLSLLEMYESYSQISNMCDNIN